LYCENTYSIINYKKIKHKKYFVNNLEYYHDEYGLEIFNNRYNNNMDIVTLKNSGEYWFTSFFSNKFDSLFPSNNSSKVSEFLYDKINDSKIDYLKYTLIGIGEFSHGIQETWDYRFQLLKKLMKKSTKNICIFCDISVWQGANIMNDIDIQFEEIIIDKTEKSPTWGKLSRYVHHTSESSIFLNIIKYIRKYKNRIRIIGIDNDKLDRDYDMYTIIKNNLDDKNINFLWAHNNHVDDRLLNWDTFKLTKEAYPDHKWSCGHYLKKQMPNRYCIILSNACKGENRFNSYCEGDGCSNRIWKDEYFYKKFVFDNNNKIVFDGKKYKITWNYNNLFMEFSNSYYLDNKQGEQAIANSNNWDYVLLWDNVSRLVAL